MSANLRITLAVSSVLFVLAPALSFAGAQIGKKSRWVRHPTFHRTLDATSQVESSWHQTVLSALDQDPAVPASSLGWLEEKAAATRPHAVSRIVSVFQTVFTRSVSTNIFLSTLIL